MIIVKCSLDDVIITPGPKSPDYDPHWIFPLNFITLEFSYDDRHLQGVQRGQL